jgi:hypothetical protein
MEGQHSRDCPFADQRALSDTLGGCNIWQNAMGRLKATAANLLLKPIAVEPAGNEAMLNFGFALVSKAPSFTFPHASNLKAVGI